MIKKFWILMLVLLLALAACGDDADEDNGDEAIPDTDDITTTANYFTLQYDETEETTRYDEVLVTAERTSDETFTIALNHDNATVYLVEVPTNIPAESLPLAAADNIGRMGAYAVIDGVRYANSASGTLVITSRVDDQITGTFTFNASQEDTETDVNTLVNVEGGFVALEIPGEDVTNTLGDDDADGDE